MLSVSGMALFLLSELLIVQLLGLVISTAGSLGVGTNSHTSSHNATSDRRWVNDLLTYFGFPFFIGVSATYWRHSHVGRHHPNPNILNVDHDHDLMPWFSLIRNQFENINGLRRFYYERLQLIAFIPALLMNAINMQKSGWIYVFKALFKTTQRSKSHWLDLLALVAHLAFWVGIPFLIVPPSQAIWAYPIRIAFIGYAMFAVLAPGHFPKEAQSFDVARAREMDFVRLQTSSSINFKPTFIGNFFCSGLQYQIEHHLFPGICHTHYSKVSKLVKQFCQDNGYQHISYSWPRAIWESIQVIKNPKTCQISNKLTGGNLSSA